MKAKWLIEHFDNDNSFHRLYEECKALGYSAELIRYHPVAQGSVDRFASDNPVIIQASLQFGQEMMQRFTHWIPGWWFTKAKYECTYYYAHLQRHLFNDRFIMMPRACFPSRAQTLYDEMGQDDCLFIRPSSGFKTFTGKVFDKYLLHQDWDWVEEFTKPEDIIVVSSPKNIRAEYRFVVVCQDVITGSLYKEMGSSKRRELDINIEFDKLSLEKAKEVIADGWQPDPVYVMDICIGWDNKSYLLEIGTFNCAGLYACDLTTVVTCVSEEAERQYLNYIAMRT